MKSPLTGLRSAGSTWLSVIAMILALFWGSPARAGDTLRCGSRIISIEAIAPAVLSACGEPAYRDVWQYYDDSLARYVGDTEVWTYNFGSNQLLRILRFRNGHLNRIDTDGYGFRVTQDSRCGPNDIVTGISKYRLVSFCGEPAAQRSLGFLAPYRPRDGYRSRDFLPPGQYLSPSYREEWTYNFGARFLLRIVMLENGRVVDVEDGGHGYDAP